MGNRNTAPKKTKKKKAKEKGFKLERTIRLMLSKRTNTNEPNENELERLRILYFNHKRL